jgi:hypothetical protein
VSDTDRNWRRALEGHESLHLDNEDQATALTRQAALVRWLEPGHWECRQCSKSLLSLNSAVHHACLSAVRRRDEPKRPDKRRKPSPPEVSSASAFHADAVPVMPDLEYSALSIAFARNYATTARLASVNASSIVNLARLPEPVSCGPVVGDVFRWPGRPDSFANVWRLGKNGKAHVIEFRRRPLLKNSKCSLHPDGGGCWRVKLPLTSEVIALPSDFSRTETLIPRTSASDRASGGCLRSYNRCFQLCRSSDFPAAELEAKAQVVLDFVEAAAQCMVDDAPDQSDPDGQLASPWTQAVVGIFSDATTLRIDALKLPESCPKSSSGGVPCEIIKRGRVLARRLVSSEGCRRLNGQQFGCKTHDVRWHVPHGASSVDCNIVGDVLGQYLVAGDFWPEALGLFHETESYRALERMLCKRTSTVVTNAVRQHRLRDGLSEAESMLLHSALVLHCRNTPNYQTIKTWLQMWVDKMVAPVALLLACHILQPVVLLFLFENHLCFCFVGSAYMSAPRLFVWQSRFAAATAPLSTWISAPLTVGSYGLLDARARMPNERGAVALAWRTCRYCQTFSQHLRSGRP